MLGDTWTHPPTSIIILDFRVFYVTKSGFLLLVYMIMKLTIMRFELLYNHLNQRAHMPACTCISCECMQTCTHVGPTHANTHTRMHVRTNSIAADRIVTFVTFVDLLLFSSFSDIPGASRIKTCDTSRIKT